MAISNASNQIVKVNLIPGIIPSVLHLSQYDTGAGRPITFSVYDGSQAFTIPSGVSIAFEGTKPDGNGFSFTCSKSGSNALLTNYTNQMTALPGKIMCQLVFTDTSGGRVGSLPVLMVVTPAGINGDTVISDSDIEAIIAAQSAYAVTNARLDTAISAATQDSEVQDIRVKADGTSATTAGNAVREQITELKNDLSDVSKEHDDNDAFIRTLGYYGDKQITRDFIPGMFMSGNYRTDGNYGKVLTTEAPFNVCDFSISVSPSGISNMKYMLSLFTADDVYIMNSAQNSFSDSVSVTKQSILAINQNAAKIYVTLLRVDGSSILDFPDSAVIRVVRNYDEKISIVDKVDDNTEALNDAQAFLQTLGYTGRLSIITKAFQPGTWYNDTYRTDGNYGKYRSTAELFDLKDFKISVMPRGIENLIYSWTVFDSNGTRIGAKAGGPSAFTDEISLNASDIKASFPGASKIGATVGRASGSTILDLPEGIEITVFDTETAENVVNAISGIRDKMIPNGIDYLFPKNQKYKINLVGDSISQGVFSTDARKDSWAGILRNMISADLGGQLNYGFAPFNIANNNHYWTSNVLSWGDTAGAATNNADGRVFGSYSYHLETVDAVFRINVLDYNVKKIKVAYLGGVAGEIEVYRNSTLLGTLTETSAASQEAKMSTAFDVGTLTEAEHSIKLILKSGEAYVSGFELIYDDGYTTFNNYALAGTSTAVQVDDTMGKEFDCDFLIFALGYNDMLANGYEAFAENIARYIPMIKAKNCETVVLDFIWNGASVSAASSKATLKDMAKSLGCLYLDFAELTPKKANGTIIDDFFTTADNVHPSDFGHRFIAEMIAKKIGLSHRFKLQVIE